MDPILLRDVGTYISFNLRENDLRAMAWAMQLKDSDRLGQLQRQEFAVLRSNMMNRVVFGRVPDIEE